MTWVLFESNSSHKLLKQKVVYNFFFTVSAFQNLTVTHGLDHTSNAVFDLRAFIQGRSFIFLELTKTMMLDFSHYYAVCLVRQDLMTLILNASHMNVSVLYIMQSKS